MSQVGGKKTGLLQTNMNEYRKQLQKGAIKEAYKGLMDYLDQLRLHLKGRYPHYFLSDVHYGAMDFTYFYFFPKTLKSQNLKVMILFVHDTFKFEVLLAGYNKETQEKCWKVFKAKEWSNYRLAPGPRDGDSIMDFVLADNPDFSDLDALTNRIESGTLKFIADIENFLASTKP